MGFYYPCISFSPIRSHNFEAVTNWVRTITTKKESSQCSERVPCSTATQKLRHCCDSSCLPTRRLQIQNVLGLKGSTPNQKYYHQVKITFFIIQSNINIREIVWWGEGFSFLCVSLVFSSVGYYSNLKKILIKPRANQFFVQMLPKYSQALFCLTSSNLDYSLMEEGPPLFQYLCIDCQHSEVPVQAWISEITGHSCKDISCLILSLFILFLNHKSSTEQQLERRTEFRQSVRNQCPFYHQSHLGKVFSLLSLPALCHGDTEQSP